MSKSAKKGPKIKPQIIEEVNDNIINNGVSIVPNQQIEQELDQEEDQEEHIKLSIDKSFKIKRDTENTKNTKNLKRKKATQGECNQIGIEQQQPKKQSKKIKTNQSKNIQSNQQQQQQDNEDMVRIVAEIDPEYQKITEDDFEIPIFLQKQYIRDKYKNKPEDPEYDETTLYIPEDEQKKFSPMFHHYWCIKSENYDKLVAYKLGKFYFFYYNDAFTIKNIFDLQLSKWGKKPLIFIQEQILKQQFTQILIDKGYKLAIVEQMEREALGDNQLIRRELCQIITKGTYIDSDDNLYEHKYILSIIQLSYKFSVCFLDTTTHKAYLDEFQDDQTLNKLKSLIHRMKPVEVIAWKTFINQQTLSLIKCNLLPQPQISLINTTTTLPSPDTILEIFSQHFIDSHKILTQIQINDSEDDLQSNNLFTQSNVKYPWPPLLIFFAQEIRKYRIVEHKIRKQESVNNNTLIILNEQDFPYYLTLQSLYLIYYYLKKLLLVQTVFPMTDYKLLDIELLSNNNLLMDSQTLNNLEIFELQQNDKILTQSQSKPTLFQYLNYTKTSFGYRLLKKWIVSPLTNVDTIQSRQDSIEDFLKNSDILDYFREQISKLPDIERLITKIYNGAQTTRLSANYSMENFANEKLKEFMILLKHLKNINTFMQLFDPKKFKSLRLKQLVTFQTDKNSQFVIKNNNSVEGIFPRIGDIISIMEKQIQIRDDTPVPAVGVDSYYDSIVDKINEVKEQLNRVINQYKKYYKDNSITYIHGKFRYEMEISEQLLESKGISNIPNEFQLLSKRKGFKRFHTPEIIQLVQKLNELEDDLKQSLVPFIVRYFKQFYDYNTIWQQLIVCLAELDCLGSLAISTNKMQIRCRPQFINNQNIFKLYNMKHPCLFQQNNIVCNDIIFDPNIDIMLITGPNMGGKSTLMRQVCIATIIAQIGCYVPCSGFILSPIDKIYTRLGASDSILEGKSTFYSELEETLQIVKGATKNSLVVLDELGRGTSTYDGLAIAYSVLKYISTKIQCKTLFTTHYHLLIEDFSQYKNIQNYYMASTYNPEKDTIEFLYKFQKGIAMQSYGINVAKMAGLPDSVINNAKQISENMIKEGTQLNTAVRVSQKFNKIIDLLDNFDDIDLSNFDINLQEKKSINKVILLESQSYTNI